MTETYYRKANFCPTFRGRHNAVKSKCLIVLYNRKFNGERGLTLSELTRATGSNYKSLSVLLKRWVGWRYVGYHQSKKGRVYDIRKRGVAWVDRWNNIMPTERYNAELEQISSRGKEQQNET
jgi:hypothetical protein